MAVITTILCPSCDKKFKPKSLVQGKKIKCPLCAHVFVAPAESAKADTKAKPDRGAASKAKPQAVEEAKKPAHDDLDMDHNPYGVKDQDLTPRCPHCAKELKSANSIICLYCGYNTLTREAGKTEKIIGLTFERHLMYLLPAIGSAVFSFFAVVFLLYYTIVSPPQVEGVFLLWMTDHESLRMWTTVMLLGCIFAAGTFCFKKFIEQPKPDEIKNE